MVFSIRAAEPKDAGLILALLRELAEFENLLGIFATSEAIILRDFFGARPAVHCELAFEGSHPVGVATFLWTYGSFTTSRGLFVEDLFVRPAFRGRGYGKALLKHLAAKGAARLDWLVLDWNAHAVAFYQEIGARPVEGWRLYRLEGEAMKSLTS